MRLRRLLLASLLLIALSSLPASSAPDQGAPALFQVSTIDALMAGLYDGVMTVHDLRAQGDFGLGTFDHLDGEMVVLGGRVYRVSSDGVARLVPDGTRTPFAAVTVFHPEKTEQIESVGGLSALIARLDRMLPSPNLFYAVRVDGEFEYVKTRSVPRQIKPYPRLADVTAKQPTFEFADVKGTIVAFRCPYFVKSVNVPGWHLHFLDADRKRGGHLLECRVRAATVSYETLSALRLWLPVTGDFPTHLLPDAGNGSLEKVEKGR